MNGVPTIKMDFFGPVAKADGSVRIAALIAPAVALLLAAMTAKADGLSTVKECESDTGPPEEVAR
jgi:hypothetical protein